MAENDDAFLDETPRRPLLSFNYRWTGIVIGVMGLLSFGVAMSTVAASFGWLRHVPHAGALPDWLQIAVIVFLVLVHFASLVGFLSTLVYGLRRTGDDAAVLIQGRRFSGLRLGAFYLGCFASPWAAHLLFSF